MPPRKIKEKSGGMIVSSIVAEPVSGQSLRVARRIQPIVFVFGVLSVCALGLAGYFYYQYSHTKEVMEEKEIADITKKISKVMELPQNEKATLATVTNKEKLDNQSFFRKAENGDKILIYTDAGQAILYRPSTEKIIDMTSVTITDEQLTTPAVEESPSVLVASQEEISADEVVAPIATTADTLDTNDTGASSATVALYNGSRKVGVTNTLETELIGAFENISIALKEKAVKNDYVGTMVIALSPDRGSLAEKIAETVGGTVVADLPSGEINSGTDIVIIVGNK